jgi:hypothetical protein
VKKLKLNVDDLRVDGFDTTGLSGSPGTVYARSCQYPGDADYTEYYSTCEVGSNMAAGCFSDGCTVSLTTFEDTCDVCTNVDSCGCDFSEMSNCHRCR